MSRPANLEIGAALSYRAMRVEVSEYDESWRYQFERIKEELERILKGVEYHSIEHVGSTSVPGLCAKPVIDVDIIVSADSLERVLDAIRACKEYCLAEELCIPDRYQVQPCDKSSTPRRNVYVCLEGSQALRNHLIVRDLCREDKDLRKRYARLKRDLSLCEWQNVDEYCSAKTAVLIEILRQGGLADGELREIALVNGVKWPIVSEKD